MKEEVSYPSAPAVGAATVVAAPTAQCMPQGKKFTEREFLEGTSLFDCWGYVSPVDGESHCCSRCCFASCCEPCAIGRLVSITDTGDSTKCIAGLGIPIAFILTFTSVGWTLCFLIPILLTYWMAHKLGYSNIPWIQVILYSCCCNCCYLIQLRNFLELHMHAQTKEKV